MGTHRLLAAAVAVVLAAPLASCASAAEPAASGPLRAAAVEARTVSLDESTALGDVAGAARALGLSVLSQADRQGNVVLSPASLASALAMLAEGARGESLAQLDAALGATGDDRSDAFAALRGALAALEGDPAAATGDELPDRPIVHLARNVVIDDQLTPTDEFLDAMADVFDAGIDRADLGSPAAKEQLTEWVRHHSGGLIRESAIEPDPDLRLVLQDAILLAARWKAPFDANGTREDPFQLPDGTTASVEMMHQVMWVVHAEVDGWEAVRLPYVDALHADVILPPAGSDPASITEAQLAALGVRLDAADPTQVDLALPTIDTGTTRTDLIDLMPALGLGSLLCDEPGTDLSGIGGVPGELCLDQGAQQAVLRVDEGGTVAVAVTEFGVTETSAGPPPTSIAFDRPFLFTVAHTDSGWPLFQAAIRDPRH